MFQDEARMQIIAICISINLGGLNIVFEIQNNHHSNRHETLLKGNSLTFFVAQTLLQRTVHNFHRASTFISRTATLRHY